MWKTTFDKAPIVQQGNQGKWSKDKSIDTFFKHIHSTTNSCSIYMYVYTCNVYIL